MQYYDFTILISADGAGKYSARAESERYGEPDAIPLVLPDASTLEEIRTRFEKRQTDRAYLQSLGRDLFKRIIAGNISDTFLLSLGEVRNDPDRGLRLRLRIIAPEVAALPWELLYSDLDQAFVGTRTKTPLIRYLDMARPIGELATPFPLRILVAIPRSGELDAAGERSVIERAVDGLGDKVEVTYVHERYPDGKVTWWRISQCLAERKFHCFHFVGHGDFRRERGYLLLDGDDDGHDPVEDERFAELFVNSASIRLVVLNACKGATLSNSQRLSGTAARLVQCGVPSVVAMQFAIYDDAAVAFARSFYHSLFVSDNHGRVDVAVSRGRQALMAKFADQRELCAPVLFVHAKNAILFVPEAKGTLANLPKNTAQLHTLETARAAASSESEAEKFRRRIRIAKRSVQTGIAIGIFIFCLSAIRILDVFTIDTQAEFAVMALGNGLNDHTVSDDLRIVTIAGGGLDTEELRDRTSSTIAALDAAGAAVVAIDAYYPAERGEFRTAPESGKHLVDTIRDANVPVVIGGNRAEGGRVEVPESLRAVVADVGYLCYESKLSLTRSLPISARVAGTLYPSFALASFAAFAGGSVVEGPGSNVAKPTVAIPDRASVQFDVSELNDVRRRTNTCSFIGNGDLVAHRFIRRTPDELLGKITMAWPDATERSATAPDALRAAFAGRLVLVGVLGRGDTVSDLAGMRDGVLWQADAINNLLLDEIIVPMPDGYQLMLMLLLAGFATAVRLQLSAHRRVRVAVVSLMSTAIVIFVVFLYGSFGVLVNPVYYLIAVWLSWWAAGRFGETWLVN